MNNYVLEVYSERQTRLLSEHFKAIGNNKYQFTGTKQECSKMQRRMARKGIYGDIFKQEYNRSTNYRRIFLASRPDQEEFRCCYCGRTYPRSAITVDHIVPVAGVKTNYSSRIWLKLKGCDNVNDVKNLVPACRRCNEKKGSSSSLIYTLRATYGESRLYWIIARSVHLVLALAIVYLLYKLNRGGY